MKSAQSSRSPARVWFSCDRAGVIAANTMTEAARQRIFLAVVILALGVVFGARMFREFNFGASELKFVMDFGFGAVGVFGSVLAIVITAQLFFGEIENRTALTLLAKPVLRSEFIVGKFVGVAAVLFVFTALTTLALAGSLWWRESTLMVVAPGDFAHGRIVPYAGLAGFALLQWMKLGLLAGITMLVASFSQTNLFTVAMAFLVLVICHLQHFARDAWLRAGGWGGRVAGALLSVVFPDFQLFDAGDHVAAGGGMSFAVLGFAGGYAFIYLGAVLALAVFSFSKREI